MHCFTSIINNYIPKARILAKTLKKQHPDWTFHVVMSEPLDPSIRLEQEPFDDVIMIHQLGIPNLEGWIFRHKVTEICTAVKGPASIYLMDVTGADKLMYLDPDIAVFNGLQELDDLLDAHPILLAPHVNKPEKERQHIVNNEICSLRYGVFNLGFMAVRGDGQGREFAEWWRDRLMEFCYDDIPFGLFTDQRWCDLAPIFFDQLYILRQSEYDVATWNLTHREVTMGQDGTILVDGKPLRFYHFSGYDSGAGANMVEVHASENQVVLTLWQWYERQLAENGHELLGKKPWHYGKFDNGEPITDQMRAVYKVRLDLQRHFPDPFTVQRPDGGFYWWWYNQYLPYEAK